MNPLAIGLIGIGIVLLLFGIFTLTQNKRTKGLVLSIAGLLFIGVPFVASYLVTR